jgi:VWFA-related protein
MHRRLRLAGLLALLAGISLNAGQAPSSSPTPQLVQPVAQPTPTFKLQVDYVDVDVLVSDEAGRFVRDLTREDFEVFEDGRLQSITDFTLVDIPVERPDRPLFATEAIEPDVQTNAQPFEGRTYVLFLDDLHTQPLRSTLVKRVARQFIERHLGANDLMAVVHSRARTDAAQEFTSNKRLLLAAVDKFMGAKTQSATLARTDAFYGSGRTDDPFDAERGFNAQSTMGTLRSIAEWFGGVRGRRKTILFVSEGIDYDITDIIREDGRGGGVASAIYSDIRETIAVTARSNVSIYAIDPRGMTALADDAIGVSSFPDQTDPGGAGIGLTGLANEVRLSQDSLRTLAEETGGVAVVNRNDFATAFDRIVSDNSSYYVLAYYPPTTRRDGRFHKIDVRVKRPGLRVRARRGYTLPRNNRAPARVAKADGASPEVLEALNSPLPISGLGLRVIAAPFRGTPPNASVLLGVEITGRDIALQSNGRVEMAFLAIDATGKIRENKSSSLTMNLRPETRARVDQTGFRLLNRLNLPPGRYQVRVAARDTAGGGVGSVIYDLEIPEYDKLPFSMSGLVVTSQVGATMVTAQGDEQLKAVLPAPPTGQRTFPQGDELALFTEVYDDGRLPSHRVDITATVTTDEGRVLYKAEENRSSSELEGKRGAYGYGARIPLSELEPGPYVLTVEARSSLGAESIVSRQLQFDVVASQPAR